MIFLVSIQALRVCIRRMQRRLQLILGLCEYADDPSLRVYAHVPVLEVIGVLLEQSGSLPILPNPLAHLKLVRPDALGVEKPQHGESYHGVDQWHVEFLH